MSTTAHAPHPLIAALRGWFTPLLFLAVLAGGALLAYRYLLPLDGPLDQDSTLLFTRYTARLSFFLFLPVFALSAWHHLWPSGVSRFLLGRRRQLGLAFALAHAVHLCGIVLHYLALDAWFSPQDTAAILIYVFIGLMAITSNSLSVRRLKGAWRVLHKIGIYAIFIGFFATYLNRVIEHDISTLDPALQDSLPAYVVLLILVSSAWLLRILVFWKRSF